MPNRTACDVLEAMRKCNETKNFSYLPGLVEELQDICNRMEAALYDQHDLRYAAKTHSKLKKEIKALEEKKEKLEENDDKN